MRKQTIKKAISIQASRETIWDILTKEKYNRMWLAEFSEGSHAQTDWSIGSKVIFSDNSGSGLVGLVKEHTPGEVLSIEYEGEFRDGVEDYKSISAREWKGAKETYRLKENAGHLRLHVECDMLPEMFAPMSEAWERALKNIKHLAEH